ncbi:MAG: ribbon-helix-helix domain-containing protein [Syntrophorhabdaceae bacterium]|nr:ribbon-helix-helix domain-containing protein [Syntrophorhabdaceae bacterium]
MEVVMITVRLPKEMEKKLETIARNKNKTKTDVIKEALERLISHEESEKDSYELGKDFFGRYGSGDGLLSITYREKIKGKIHAKLRARLIIPQCLLNLILYSLF